MRNFKCIGCNMFVAGLVLCGSHSVARADGRIVIDPRVHSAVEYTTNFWKAENDEVGVYTYSIKPGVVLGYETPKTKADADLSVDAYWYDDQDTPPPGIRDSSDDDYVGFTGSLAVSNQLFDRLKIGAQDSLMLTRDPASADVFNDSVTREKYTINRFNPNIYYDFGNKFGLEMRYGNTYTDYTEDLGGEDSVEHRGTLNLNYNLNRTSSIYVNYQVWNRDYDVATSAYTSNKVTLNYAHAFNFLTFIGGAGYHNRSFDVAANDDIDMFTWNLSVKGEEKVTGERKSRYKMVAAVGQDLNDAGAGEQYFIVTHARIEGNYLFMGKLGAGARLEYQNSEYQNDPENREDDLVTAAGKLSYDILDYLTFGVEGGVKQRNSNIVGRDYDDNFVMATLDFDYSFGSK